MGQLILVIYLLYVWGSVAEWLGWLVINRARVRILVAALPSKTLDKLFHSVARQCDTVVRVTQQVNGKWQFWGYQNSVTPEPIH